jgi:hypothetical protein
LLHGRGIVVIEVAARRKQLDRLEPVAGNFGQVVALEPTVVIEVRGNAKPRGLRRSNAAN